MNLEHIPALSEDELNVLGNLLEDECEKQDSFDFFATHGAITALLVSPKGYDYQQLLDLVFEQKPSFNDAQMQNFSVLIQKLVREISSWLDAGQDFPIPCELTLNAEEDEESAPLESWTAGFISLVLSQEEAWYATHEEQIAQWLLPIMYASGFFLDEPEMAEIDEDEELSHQVCSHIPANIVELYLHYHSK